ncbi:MAG: ATP-dependent helicase RhlE [Chloroflexota bacterium]|jgi:ATP-dependent RNA helicase RhlE|nr:ATP-dependent helicase RhlE [Chloroflexota bacterium]
MPFDTLGLSPEILRAVREEGYTEPTPVQEQAIPYVLAGRDLMARAQTGTGKTAAFVLPILERLKAHSNTSFSPARHPVRALIVTPTRELAVQIADSVSAYGRHVPLRSLVVYGGVPMPPQERALLGGIEILVATPGRLLDHAGSKKVNLSQVEVLVLDEADRMLDMGFIDDIRKIIAMLPARRQNLMFSATFSPDIRRLAEGILNDPAQVDVAPKVSAAELVEQIVYLVDADRKRELLAYLVRKRDLKQVLVFCRTKHMAARLASWLDRDGVEATAIHGDRTQPERERALEAFKAGEVRVLVATDVAARGLDIEALPHVVNFELPMHAQDYVHRIGRTGRAGMEGHAISLVSFEEEDQLKQINRLLKRDLPVRIINGYEPGPAPSSASRAGAYRRSESSGSSGSGARSRAPRRGAPSRVRAAAR